MVNPHYCFQTYLLSSVQFLLSTLHILFMLNKRWSVARAAKRRIFHMTIL